MTDFPKVVTQQISADGHHLAMANPITNTTVVTSPPKRPTSLTNANALILPKPFLKSSNAGQIRSVQPPESPKSPTPPQLPQSPPPANNLASPVGLKPVIPPKPEFLKRRTISPVSPNEFEG